MLEFSNSTYPKAKKEYKCDLCNQAIHKGKVYHRWSGKYDGDIFDCKYHPVCQEIISAYCNAMNDSEYSNDEIYDWLHDEYCLDCKHYENDDCTEYPLSCPLIRKHFEKGSEENG